MDAVIVDLEGVIRDSKNAFHHAYEHALSSTKLRLHAYPIDTWRLRGFAEFNYHRNFLRALYAVTKSKENLNHVFWKKHPVEYVKELIKKNGPTREALERLDDSYHKFLLTPSILRRIPPVRAGKMGIKLLKEDGYKIGAVTNSADRYNASWIKQKKMENHFDCVVTADQVGTPKPEPDAILKVCQKLKVKPAKVVYAGDSEADIMAAKAAGTIPIGITSGATERRVLRTMGATYVFKSMTEFALWVRRGGKI